MKFVGGRHSAVFNDGWSLFHFELDEDRVVANIRRTGPQLIQRQKPRISETDAASGIRTGRVPGRTLELLTSGTRDKTLDDVLTLLGVLVVENDRDGQSKRPVEQSVVVAGNDPDVDGQVRALTRATSGRKQRRSKSIAVRRCVESSAFDLINKYTLTAYAITGAATSPRNPPVE